MRTSWVAQGPLRNAPWPPRWEGKPRKGDICIGRAESHTQQQITQRCKVGVFFFK